MAQRPLVELRQCLLFFEMQKRKNLLTRFIDDWHSTWEKKDLENYISFYSNDFNSQGMDRDAWKKFKEKLNQTYSMIQVKLSKPVVLTTQNRAIIRMLQAYTSDIKSDFGEKILYLQKEHDSYKIIGEEWVAEHNKEAMQEVQGIATSASLSEHH